MKTIGPEEERIFSLYLRRPTRRRLTKVVKSFHEHVWALAYRFTGNEEDASDIAQDLFLSLLLHPPGYGEVRSARGYIACRVLSFSSHAKRSGERRRLREQVAIQKTAVDDGLPSVDLEAVHNAIGQLPARTRKAVEYRYFAGLRNREIAELLGVSERTVEDELRQGRESMRSRLGSGAMAVLAFLELDAGAVPIPPAELKKELLLIAQSGNALLPTAVRALAPAGFVGKKALAIVALFLVLAGLGGWVVLRKDTLPEPNSMPGHRIAALKDPSKPVVEEKAAPISHLNPETAAKDLLQISGWVVDGDGEVIAGAKVEIYSGPTTLSRASSKEAMALFGQATTNAAGEFVSEGKIPDREGITVVAEKEGAGKGWCRLDALPRSRPGATAMKKGVMVVLFSSTADLSGRVLDQDDQSIEGCLVRVSIQAGAAGEPYTWGAIGAETAKTDANGEFVVRGLPASAPLDVFVERGGYYRGFFRQVMAGGMPLELRLERGSKVTGRVVIAGGEPVAGAMISLVEATSHGDLGLRSILGKSGEDGSFALDGVPPDIYELSVRPPDSYREPTAELLDVKAPPVELVIELEKNASQQESGEATNPVMLPVAGENNAEPPFIRGTILDPNGSPVVAIVGSTRSPGATGFGETVRESVSKPDGSFLLEYISFPTSLVVSAPSRALRKALAIETQPEIDVVVQLEPYEPCRIEGRVVTPQGNTVPGAGVLICRTWRDLKVGVGATKADEQGVFIFEGLLPDTSYDLHALAGEIHGPAARAHVKVGKVPYVNVLLPPNDATLIGIVKNRQGAPLSGIKVFYDYTDDDVPREERVVSGADGTFQVSGLLSGKYRVVVDEIGYGMWIGGEDSDQKVIVPGAPLDITLTGTRAVTFEVADHAGHLLSAAYVCWGNAPGHPLRAPKGRFIAEVPETETRLKIQRDYRGIHPIERELLWPPSGDLDLGRIELQDEGGDE